MNASRKAASKYENKTVEAGLDMTETPFEVREVEIPFLRRIGNQKAACDVIKISIGHQNPKERNGMPKYRVQAVGFQAGAELSFDAARHQFKNSIEKMAKSARSTP